MFNVLYEPWMGVIDMNGKEKLVGLRDYLVNSHTYKRSAENKQFAVLRRLQQRLAEMVIIDIYGRHITEEDDVLIRLYEDGKFDAKKIDDYFETCINSGISFDLFDKERPFMQVDEETANKIFKPSNRTSVASINPRMSSGRNKVFFQHIRPEEYLTNAYIDDDRVFYYDDAYKKEADGAYGYEVKFEDYINLLLLRHCLAGFGGAGYKCGIACVGKPPVMYQIDDCSKRQSLFSSILLNIPYCESNTDDGLPLWRWPTYTYAIESMEEQSCHVPLLCGMLFPVVYLRADYESINIEKRTIKKIYKTGMPFNMPGTKIDMLEQATQDWLINTEPSVATLIQSRKDKDDRTIGLSFDDYTKAWLDIKTYANIYDKNAPKVLKNSLYEKMKEKYKEKIYEDVEDADLIDDEDDLSIEMSAYYLSMNQSSYLSQGKYLCCLPECILEDRAKYIAIKNFIEMVGLRNYKLSDSEEPKPAIGNWLQKEIKTINSAIKAVDGKPNLKSKKTYMTVERTLMTRYWRFCEVTFKNKYIKDLEAIKQEKCNDKKEYLSKIQGLLESYEREILIYCRRLLKDIPVPKGKSILVKKELYRKKKENKK